MKDHTHRPSGRTRRAGLSGATADPTYPADACASEPSAASSDETKGLAARMEVATGGSGPVAEPPMPEKDPTRVERGLSFEEYLASDAQSRSDLHVIERETPADYQFYKANGGPVSDVLTFGSAVHCALFEPDRYWESYTEKPDLDKAEIRTKSGELAKNPAATVEGKELLERFAADHAHMTILPTGDAWRAWTLGALARAHPVVALLLEGEMELETSLFWAKEAKNGLVIPLRSRPDAVNLDRKVSIDLKISRKLGVRHYQSEVVDHGYDMQGAMVMDAVQATMGLTIQSHIMVWLRHVDRPEVDVRRMSADFIGAGYERLQRGVDIYADCIDSGEWPGLAPRIQELEAPSWYLGRRTYQEAFA